MNEVEFLLRCRIDFKFFCEEMLEMKEFGGIHKFQLKWFYHVQNNDLSVIEAPSGFSKTEIIGVAYPLWKAFVHTKKSIEGFRVLLVSKTVRQAGVNILERIKERIQDSAYLSEMVPTGIDKVWNKEEIGLIKSDIGVKITMRNVPYNINIKGYRAELIICDEGDSYEQQDIFFTHVLSRITPGNKVIVISTPEGPTKLIGQIKDKAVDKNGICMFACRKDVAIVGFKGEDYESGESIWPERFNMDYIMKQRLIMGENAWQMNYMCNTNTEYSDTIFQVTSLAECYDDTIDFNTTLDPQAQYFIGADFAISKGVDADFDCFAVVEKKDEWITIKHIETWKGKTRPFKIERLNALYDTYSKHKKARIIADMSNMGQMVIDDLRGMGLTVVPQNFSAGKRKDLLNTFAAVIESGKFVIPRKAAVINSTTGLGRGGINKTIDDTNLMVSQLLGFKRVASKKTGNEIYQSTAVHDDVAMTVAMAAKESTYIRPISGSILGISG